MVGFDDIEMASWEAFDLTTVRQPIGEMARRATATLLARIADPEGPRVTEKFGSQLIVRGSTARSQPCT